MHTINTLLAQLGELAKQSVSMQVELIMSLLMIIRLGVRIAAGEKEGGWGTIHTVSQSVNIFR